MILSSKKYSNLKQLHESRKTEIKKALKAKTESFDGFIKHILIHF